MSCQVRGRNRTCSPAPAALAAGRSATSTRKPSCACHLPVRREPSLLHLPPPFAGGSGQPVCPVDGPISCANAPPCLNANDVLQLPGSCSLQNPNMGVSYSVNGRPAATVRCPQPGATQTVNVRPVVCGHPECTYNSTFSFDVQSEASSPQTPLTLAKESADTRQGLPPHAHALPVACCFVLTQVLPSPSPRSSPCPCARRPLCVFGRSAPRVPHHPPLPAPGPGHPAGGHMHLQRRRRQRVVRWAASVFLGRDVLA